ncbi:MAG TPA: hypothetical protein VFH56_14355 [Acidimicrobiales bacterium]|nr:hypothetical protein [Acidimicrobiales bacterium]
MTAPWRETVAEALAAVRATGEKVVPEHGCGGDLDRCVSTCPVPYALTMPPEEIADALAPLIERLLTEARAEALREAADAVARRDGNRLIAALLALPANDTSRDVADWIEGMLRERADSLARTAAQPATSTEEER